MKYLKMLGLAEPYTHDKPQRLGTSRNKSGIENAVERRERVPS